MTTAPLYQAGLTELATGLRNWRLCHLIGLSEIRRRYRRSYLGQFWLTASTAITIVALGLVWSVLWKVDSAALIPYLSVSLILWTLITGVLSEAPTVFVTAGPIFLNQGTSFATAIYALVYKHFVIFLHNLPIAAIVFLFYKVPVGATAVYSLIGLVLLVVTLVWSSYLLAIVCLRFRDLIQVVQSVIMIAFFITPVLWKADQLPAEQSYWLSFNPFAMLISVVRDPLMGEMPSMSVWIIAGLLSIGGLIVALPTIGFRCRRLVYWI